MYTQNIQFLPKFVLPSVFVPKAAELLSTLHHQVLVVSWGSVLLGGGGGDALTPGAPSVPSREMTLVLLVSVLLLGLSPWC